MNMKELLATLRQNVSQRFSSWSDSKGALELLEAIGDVLWHPDGTVDGHLLAIKFLERIEDEELREALFELRYDAALREKRATEGEN